MQGGQQEAAAVAGRGRTSSRTRVEAVGMGKAAIFDIDLKGVKGELHPSNKPRGALAEGLGEPEKLRRQRLTSWISREENRKRTRKKEATLLSNFE